MSGTEEQFEGFTHTIQQGGPNHCGIQILDMCVVSVFPAIRGPDNNSGSVQTDRGAPEREPVTEGTGELAVSGSGCSQHGYAVMLHVTNLRIKHIKELILCSFQVMVMTLGCLMFGVKLRVINLYAEAGNISIQ